MSSDRRLCGSLVVLGAVAHVGARSGGWLAELHEVDRRLHQLVQAATQPTQAGYR